MPLQCHIYSNWFHLAILTACVILVCVHYIIKRADFSPKNLHHQTHTPRLLRCIYLSCVNGKPKHVTKMSWVPWDWPYSLLVWYLCVYIRPVHTTKIFLIVIQIVDFIKRNNLGLVSGYLNQWFLSSFVTKLGLFKLHISIWKRWPIKKITPLLY